MNEALLKKYIRIFCIITLMLLTHLNEAIFLPNAKAAVRRRTPARAGTTALSKFKKNSGSSALTSYQSQQQSKAAEETEVGPCLKEHINALISSGGPCEYLVPEEIKIAMGSDLGSFYCVFNTETIEVDGITLPSASNMFLRRYYGITASELKKDSKDLSVFNFTQNVDIFSDDRVKTDLGINYFNILTKAISENKLSQVHLSQSLLNQLKYNNSAILAQIQEKYPFDVPTTQQDITTCSAAAVEAFTACVSSKTKAKANNYQIIKDNCVKYAEILTEQYKNLATKVMIENKSLIEQTANSITPQ